MRLRALARSRLPRVLLLAVGVYVAAMVFTLPRFRTKHEQDAAELYDSSPTRVAACSAQLPGQRSADGHARGSLYDTLGGEVYDKGIPALQGTSSTQGLGLSDLFAIDGAVVTPHLTRLEVPVRAIVVPFPEAEVAPIYHHLKSVLDTLLPPGTVWFQDPMLYHSNIHHASHHRDPQPAASAEVDAEVRAVEDVARAACSLTVVLERVVVTPGGVLMACWQVADGTEPRLLRDALRLQLPRSPKQQMVSSEVILHSTLARLLRLPPGLTAATLTAQLTHAAQAMSNHLCGLSVRLPRLWFVEEEDLLALALRGTFKRHVIELECQADAAQALGSFGS